MQSRSSSIGLHFKVLDGLRGCAALIVFYQHIMGPSPDISALGVWIFFVLSGFLLVQPFYEDEHVYSASWLGGYFIRRLLRILPMYVFTIFFWFWVGLPYPIHDINWLIKHLTFQWSYGALWTIKQELAFYLVLPLVMFALKVFTPQGVQRSICLLLLCWLYYHFCSASVISSTFWRTDQSIRVSVYINLFLFGMAAGCFVHTHAAKRLSAIGNNPVTGTLSSLLLVWALIYIFYHPPAYFFAGTQGLDLNWIMSQPLGFIDAALILSLVLFPKRNILHWVISLPPLRAIGIVGYSFYMMQMAIVGLSWRINHNVIPGWAWFLMLTSLLYLVSCVTYCLIERPAMNLVQSTKKREHAGA